MLDIKIVRATDLEPSHKDRCYRVIAKYKGRPVFYTTFEKDTDRGTWWCSDIPREHSFKDIKEQIRLHILSYAVDKEILYIEELPFKERSHVQNTVLRESSERILRERRLKFN